MSRTSEQIYFERKWRLFGFVAEAYGITFKTTCFLRTSEQQQALYAKGRTAPGSIITYADGINSHSMHEYGRAADIVIIDSAGAPVWPHTKEYDLLGELWERMGGKWGFSWFKEGKTSFEDIYHFEL